MGYGKVPKAFAEYIPAGEYTGIDYCDACAMFVKPAECTKVAGIIEAKATCRFWEDRPTAHRRTPPDVGT